MPTYGNEELTTDRLYLRRPTEHDAAATTAIVGDWEVARRLGRIPHPYQRSHFDDFLEQVVPNEPTWAILLSQSDELIGMTSLVPKHKDSSAELGYYLGRAYWGRGLATEAGRAIVKFGFERMCCAKLTSRYHADNQASGNVLVKLGFRPIGTSNSYCLAEGKAKPSIELELVPDQFFNAIFTSQRQIRTGS